MRPGTCAARGEPLRTPRANVPATCACHLQAAGLPLLRAPAGLGEKQCGTCSVAPHTPRGVTLSYPLCKPRRERPRQASVAPPRQALARARLAVRCSVARCGGYGLDIASVGHDSPLGRAESRSCPGANEARARPLDRSCACHRGIISLTSRPIPRMNVSRSATRHTSFQSLFEMPRTKSPFWS